MIQWKKIRLITRSEKWDQIVWFACTHNTRTPHQLTSIHQRTRMREHLLLPVKPHGNHFTLAPRHHPFVHLKTSEKKNNFKNENKEKKKKREWERHGEFVLHVVWVHRPGECRHRREVGPVREVGWTGSTLFQPLRRPVARWYPLHQDQFPRCPYRDQNQGIFSIYFCFSFFFLNFVHVYDCLSPKFRSWLLF